MRNPLNLAISACLMLACNISAQLTPGDGTEGLVPYLGLRAGSGMAVAGTGMISGTGVININVPTGATVKQVLAIWSGQSNSDSSGDNTIELNSKVATGELVGGPTQFFSASGKPFYTLTYRADVTTLALIAPGSNSVTVSGLDFVAIFAADKGAALVVVYDDGTKANLQLREGSDNAYGGFTGDLETTVPQVFKFAASSVKRTANLDLIVAAVLEDNENIISLQIDSGAPVLLANQLGSVDGPEWDTLSLNVDIPAGATKLTVEILSQNVAGTDFPLASVTWVAAGFSLEQTVTTQCYKHLTASFWLKHKELWGPTGLKPTDKVYRVFGLDSRFSSRCGKRSWWRRVWYDRNTTLEQALSRRGGPGMVGYSRNLVRVGVAALLNARHPNVRYPLSPSTVIRFVRVGLFYRGFWIKRCYTRYLSYYNYRATLCVPR